jgi:quercetin dioxygenase-like cupin family protein
MEISRAPRSSVSASSEWITGDARIEALAAPEGPSRTRVDSVRFAPGARTRWHRHPLGQVLVVTEGVGLVQRRGGAAESIRTGDTVRIEAGEWHWHGAAADSSMTHLAIEEVPEGGSVGEFAEAVTEEEYGEQVEARPARGSVVVMDQELPESLDVKRVEVRRITIAPGGVGGLHIHNGPVFGSVEKGSAVYQIEGEPELVLQPGDVFYEPEGVRIARFDAQEEGVTFLGYFPLTEGLEVGAVFPES